MDRPLPVVDDSNRYYWDGARDHRLVMLRCVTCRTWVHPPTNRCRACQGTDLVPEPLSGRGHVYSWSVMRSPGNPGFDDRLPYAVLVVELEEQPGLLTIGNIVDCELEDIAMGMPLEVTWEQLTDEITLPQWRPAASASTKDADADREGVSA